MKGEMSPEKYPNKTSAGSKRKKVSSGPSNATYKEVVKQGPNLKGKCA